MSTPPPPSIVHTPSTPLHGPRYDAPRQTKARKQTRSTQQQPARTPSPPAHAQLSRSSHSRKSTAAATRTPQPPRPSHIYSPPSSTHTSPLRKTRAQTKGELDFAALSPDHLDSSPNMSSNDKTFGAADLAIHESLAPGMLPTPAKTPQKKKAGPALATARRVVFPNRPATIDEAMPPTRKSARKGRKHIGFSLESFDAGEGSAGEKIDIYTDSKERVPELDESEDNPFYVRPGAEHASKRRKVVDPAISQEVKDVLARNEGMYYVFRGKRTYKKFEPEELEERSTGHFTRASIKPRQLWPGKTPAHESMGHTTDEEAMTDIEEPEKHGISGAPKLAVATPVKTTVTPASPPTTTHATRSAPANVHDALGVEESVPPVPARLKRGRKPSPFDSWQRTKAVPATKPTPGKPDGSAADDESDSRKRVKITKD